MKKLSKTEIHTILEETAPKSEPERQYFFIELCREMILCEEEQMGRPLTCCIRTLGCQMNAKDSEKLLGILVEIGFSPSDSEDADLVLYNTCTVRENANLKVYGHLGYLQSLKKKHPEKLIVLCGCMMQEEHVIKKIRESYRFVDIIFGTHNIFMLAELLWRRLCEGEAVVEVWQKTNQIVEDLPSKRSYSFKSGVNIMYGCNNFCTYCIVPYVRGRERSRRPEDIIREIENLAANGVVEIMLLGQNVNSYGRDLQDPVSFAQLLSMAEQVEGIERIRFMTPHPKDLSEELIQTVKHSKKVCRHIHLPLQSGSTAVLKRMNRRYTKEQYLALAKHIREEIPEVALTTDIIVGFPGETEEDFDDTLDVVRQVSFDSAFTFIYSKRTGTPAASMEGQVSQEVVKERFSRLLKAISANGPDRMKKYLGMSMEVLAEEYNKETGLVTGRLSNNTLVHFPGEEDILGKIVMVTLEEEKGFYYLGTMLQAGR